MKNRTKANHRHIIVQIRLVIDLRWKMHLTILAILLNSLVFAPACTNQETQSQSETAQKISPPSSQHTKQGGSNNKSTSKDNSITTPKNGSSNNIDDQKDDNATEMPVPFYSLDWTKENLTNAHRVDFPIFAQIIEQGIRPLTLEHTPEYTKAREAHEKRIRGKDEFEIRESQAKMDQELQSTRDRVLTENQQRQTRFNELKNAAMSRGLVLKLVASENYEYSEGQWSRFYDFDAQSFYAPIRTSNTSLHRDSEGIILSGDIRLTFADILYADDVKIIFEYGTALMTNTPDYTKKVPKHVLFPLAMAEDRATSIKDQFKSSSHLRVELAANFSLTDSYLYDTYPKVTLTVVNHRICIATTCYDWFKKPSK